MTKRRKKTNTQTDTAAVPASPSPAPSNGDTGSINRDRIASRAYELYVARGGGGGRDVDDWLTAERELTERHKR